MRPRPAIILYVEQNRMLLQTVRDVLEFAGWYVKPCADDGYAVAYVESEEHFDLLLIDHDFRGLSGLKLAERARRQQHRRETPIVLLSLEDIAEEARLAGADAFLRYGSLTTSSSLLTPSGGCSPRAPRDKRCTLSPSGVGFGAAKARAKCSARRDRDGAPRPTV